MVEIGFSFFLCFFIFFLNMKSLLFKEVFIIGSVLNAETCMIFMLDTNHSGKP